MSGAAQFAGFFVDRATLSRMGARRGLSLLEVTIVALILAAVTVPFIESFGSFGRSVHRTTRQTAATYAAQAVMEPRVL